MDSSNLFNTTKLYLKTGDINRLHDLVDSHPEVMDLRTKDDDSLNLLHLASKNGDAAQVRMLLDVGADPADRAGKWIEDDVPEGGYYEPGWTAMMLASRSGHSDIVKILIEQGASVRDKGYWGDTALLFACIANDIETVNLLLAHGAKIDEECNIRQFDDELDWHIIGTPMHAAASCGWPEVIRCLHGHGAAVDTRLFPCGRTPLFYAAAHGHYEAVDVLLRVGADPNRREQRSGYGFDIDFTPLHYAAQKGDLETVRLLLDAGANPAAVVTYSKETVHQLAEEGGHSEVAELIAVSVAKSTG